ncbi:MAG: 4'-phosphopantetheinyl transferase superfamily protein, partial [Smithella sp.]
VGNDVVDLREPANTGKSQDSRFLKKILTDVEMEFVKNAGNSDEALWSFWACKETAYKVIKKTFPDVAFLPRRWPVTFDKSKSKKSDGLVKVPDKGDIYIHLFSNPDYIHCVGVDELSALDKIICDVENLPAGKTDPSLFSRLCLAQSLAKSFSLNLHQIKIKRTRTKGELQPPRVYIDGRKTDIDISLSHDGCFVAYAVTFLNKKNSIL